MLTNWGIGRLAGAVVLLVVMMMLDFVAPTGNWYARHPMTSAALGMLLSFWIGGLLLQGWVRDREVRKLERVSTVAYRSLAQYANDAGRTLLGALNGADLHALGVPGATQETVTSSRELLRRNGLHESFDETSGSWRTDDADALRGVLLVTLSDGTFVADLFRAVSSARRRIHEATALWAPVMLTAPSLAQDLGRYRDLSDALELLQEHLRGALPGALAIGHAPSHGWIAQVSASFWAAIAVYEKVRDEFGDLAQLPSDAVVGRRRPTTAPSPARAPQSRPTSGVTRAT